MKYDYVVFIGRFQPFHSAHFKTLQSALESGKEVIIVLGSSFAARSDKNPFSHDQRIAMIESSLTQNELDRVHFVPIADCSRNNDAWLESVHIAINEIVDKSAQIALIGFNKDNSSFYLDLFPQWARIESQSYGSLNATDLRNQIFNENGDWDFVKQNVPSGVFDYLSTFKNPLKIDENTTIEFGVKDELIKRNQVIGILTDAINDLLSIKVAFISDRSSLSDFLWGDTPENRRLTQALAQRLGIQIDRKDRLIDIADKMMLMSELRGSN